jgi:hypothetical protein
MYTKISSIPYYKVQMDPCKEPSGQLQVNRLVAPLQMTFELFNGRSYSEPQIFGPYLWFVLHTTATALPEKLNQRQQNSFTTFIKNFPVLIPCQVCREHAYAYILKTIPYTKLSTKEDIFRYLWTFHNFVNSRVANAKIPLAKAKHLYGYDFPQRGVSRSLSTGVVTSHPLHSQAGYGPLFWMSLLIAAVYYPEYPTRFIQTMMAKVIQNLGWIIPNPRDKEKVLTYLSLQNVTLAVTHRDLLFNLFYRLIQHLFSSQPPFRSLQEAKQRVNFDSLGQGQVLAFKY